MSQNKNKKAKQEEFKRILSDNKIEFSSEVYPLQQYNVTKACPTRQKKNK